MPSPVDASAAAPSYWPPAPERVCTAAGWLYLALLPCHLHLAGPLFLHDLLAPVFAAAVLWRGEWSRWRRRPDAWLAGFGLWCLVVTLLRPLLGLGQCRSAELYELAVFGYLGLLYAFFSRTHLSHRGLGLYAALVALSFWVVGAIQASAGWVQPHGAYVGTTLGFLATRYAYTFGNPNLFASFVVLPLVCALLAAFTTAGQGGALALPRRLPRCAAWALAFALPLLLSASRHLLLGAALALAGLTLLVPAPQRCRARGLAWALLASAFLVFYATVLVPFFPLRPTFPFINTRTPGMYWIHQEAYLGLATADLPSGLLGLGRSGVRQRYQQVVDPHLVQRVLAEYRMEHLAGSFLTYMDAHNEYLNLATAFGVPSLGLLIAFLASLAGDLSRRGGGVPATLALFLLVAVALACLWDDLLSKRWLWVTLGLLSVAGARAASPPPDSGAAVPGACPRP
jgi:hypothetical protein